MSDTEAKNVFVRRIAETAATCSDLDDLFGTPKRFAFARWLRRSFRKMA